VILDYRPIARLLEGVPRVEQVCRKAERLLLAIDCVMCLSEDADTIVTSSAQQSCRVSSP